jgi:protein involved in polysaccharide export with SLBB domain
MISKSSVEALGRERWAIAVTACLAVSFGVSVAGCSEHRVSLAEFQELQARMREAAAPAESATDTEAVRALVDSQLTSYKLGPSDVLEVTVTGADPVPLLTDVRARVNRDGEINLPVIGTVKVMEMELEDAEAAIHEACVPSVLRDASVYVELITESTTEVLVVGAVSLPGLVPLRRTERDMLHAIVGAGGVSELASGQATLRRIRRSREEVTLDLTDPEGIKAALALNPLERGDVVTVHAATPNMVFVGGLVNVPRPQQYPPGVEMTVLQAIAAAGGLRTDLTPREATLIRRLPDGSDAQVKLDLNRIATGKDENVLLAAGDVLWVPYTLETRIQDFINRNFFLRAGVSVNYSLSGVEYMNRNAQQSGGYRTGNLQDAFDPFGFLGRNTGIDALVNRPPE